MEKKKWSAKDCLIASEEEIHAHFKEENSEKTLNKSAKDCLIANKNVSGDTGKLGVEEHDRLTVLGGTVKVVKKVVDVTVGAIQRNVDKPVKMMNEISDIQKRRNFGSKSEEELKNIYKNTDDAKTQGAVIKEFKERGY